MEEEIDLRKYIETLFRWWWLIALAALVAGGGALLVSKMMPPTYKATAGVVLLKSKAEISLGSGIETLTDVDLDLSESMRAVTADRIERRLNSMVGMVNNGAIAQYVSEELSDQLGEEASDPSRLMAYVTGHILKPEGGGDSDTIQIIVSYSDPVTAAIIANAWAQAFERHINAVYGEAALSPFADISDQVQTAEVEYQQAQESLLTFLAEENRIAELQRQVAEEEAIIANLRAGQEADMAAAVDKQTAAQQWIFAATVADQVNAKLQVIEQQREDVLRDLNRAYERKRRLENLLVEAHLLREQMIGGGTASFGSNGLALLAFKSRVFSTVDSLPFGQLDLTLPSVDALAPYNSVEEQLADLEALIKAMEEELAAQETIIQEESDALLAGEGYQFLDDLSPEYLDVAGSQSELALLRMEAWDGILSYASIVEENLSQEIEQREEYVRLLQTEIVRLDGLKENLQTDRDLAWQTYVSLRSKEQELNITAASEGTEVRFASPALPPRSPASPRKLMNTALGLAVGLMLGVAGAFVFDYMGVESDPRALLRRRGRDEGPDPS